MASILIVDDKEENLSLLEALLTGHGHRVVAAPNGAEALRLARNSPPDLVISDILMPVMDGFSLCREWRQDDELKGKPFMFLTATYTDPKDEEFGLGIGADRFVLKPVEPDYFMQVVTGLLKEYEPGGRTSADHAHPSFPDPVFLRQYNEALIRKLEDKLADTERANRELKVYQVRLEELVEARTTDLKKANVDLQKLQELKENLTHLIIHDMRSPLAVVLGEIELALDAELPESIKIDLRIAFENTRRLTDMIGTLLDVSRMEAGEMPLSPVNHEILEIAAAVADSVSILARLKDVSVSATGTPVTCECDGQLIRRVILNLLDNAIKFSPNGGEVQIEVTRDGASARVSVTDRGPGVPEEYQTRIFDKFVQVQARTEGRAVSYGLGLTLCKLAVEAHHGVIGVRSQPNRGSLFWFTLPLSQNPASEV